MSRFLNVRGVSRAADDGNIQHRKVLEVYFSHEPTDDQLREFYDWVRDFKTVEQTVSVPQPPGENV